MNATLPQPPPIMQARPHTDEELADWQLSLTCRQWLDLSTDRRAGQHRWATVQILRIARAEAATGKRIDFVVTDEWPHEVLERLAPDVAIDAKECTSYIGNWPETQKWSEPHIDGQTVFVLDVTAIDTSVETYQSYKGLRAPNKLISLHARLAGVELVNDHMLATYELEAEVAS
jgi:hypothetical protein